MFDALISPNVRPEASSASASRVPASTGRAAANTKQLDTPPAILPDDNLDVSAQVHGVMDEMLERISRVSMSEMDPLASANETPAPASPAAVASTSHRSGTPPAVSPQYTVLTA